MVIGAWIALLLWAFVLATTLLGTHLSLKPSKVKRRRARRDCIPISVLKPLKGLDRDLRRNLECFFTLDYPEFELLFSVATPEDPARKFVEDLMAVYPDVEARLFVGEIELGPNPKINNLMRAYEGARHDLLVISDSNIRVSRDYLYQLSEHFTEGVGILTAVIAGRSAHGWGGHLEAAYLNSFYARWMRLAHFLGNPFVVGKSMLFRKSSLERFGGMRSLGRYIAEDYMAGQAMQHLGLKVEILSQPIIQHIGEHSFSAFWSRHLRWGRIRKSQAPIAFAAEPLVNALVSGALGALAALYLWDIPAHLFLLGHLGIWMVSDLVLIVRLDQRLTFRHPFFWFLRELLALPHWIHMALGSGIAWRGTAFRILPGGLVRPDPKTLKHAVKSKF